MKTKVIVAFLLILGLASRCQPDELKQLVIQSFDHFAGVSEASTYEEMGDIRLDAAHSAYLPTVVGSASYSYVDPLSKTQFPSGPDTYRTVEFQPHNNYNAGVAVNQMIWDFGRTQAQIEHATLDREGSRYKTDQVKAQLATQVAVIYYGLIFLRESMAAEDSVLVLNQENLKMVEGRFRHGDALQIDVLNAQNGIDQSLNRKTELQRLINRQLALLSYTTGSTQEPTNRAFDFGPSTNLALEANPDLMAATQRVLTAQSESQLARTGQLPNLNFQASAGIRNGYQPDLDETRFNYLVGAGLNIPIFQGGRLHQNIELADKNIEASQFAREQVSQSLMRDLALVQADIDSYAQQLETMDAQITQSREALRLAQIGYREGVATYLSLLNATTNLQQVLLGKLGIEYKRCQSYIEQSRLTGRRFWE